MEDLKKKLENLRDRLDLLAQKISVEEKREAAAKIEEESKRGDFWQDKGRSGDLMRELSSLQEEIKAFNDTRKRLDDAFAMLELGMGVELEEEVKSLEDVLKKLELKTLLGGPYDKNNAILMIHAGQGGTEAMDWAQMLERMYLRFAEKRGWQTDILDLTAGEEAGIKSVTIRVLGSYAYGYLHGEAGVHRLVRQSPFNADRLRQTSFAKVEALPEIQETEDLTIKEDDLQWEFFRSSSQGGQNVQKVSSAVRLTHKPTGIIVTCQSERYQEQNRKIALSLLRAKLWELEDARLAEAEKQLKGEVKIAGWGNQIRSYVLHPYKMIKDLRTGIETADTDKILGGDLDLFIDAELQSLVR